MAIVVIVNYVVIISLFPSILILTEKEAPKSQRLIEKFFKGPWNENIFKFRHKILAFIGLWSVVALLRIATYKNLPKSNGWGL